MLAAFLPVFIGTESVTHLDPPIRDSSNLKTPNDNLINKGVPKKNIYSQ
jgi:hypothetical protein